MNTRWSLFRPVAAALACLWLAGPAAARRYTYEERMERYVTTWEKLIPTHLKLQYAGSMGLLSAGCGWDYGTRDRWETDLMLGYVPRYESDHGRICITIKQNLMPWSVPLGSNGFSMEPLACGLYLTTILGEDYWQQEPSRYPSRPYYGISTKLRLNVYAGQRFTYEIRNDKRMRARALTLYWELSSNELYIVRACNNAWLKPGDYLHLSFGLKMQLF